MTKQPKKNPLWFSILAVVFIIWNLIGVLQYLGQVTMDDATKNQMDQELLKLMNATPKVITALFAIAVWSAFSASILLLLKKASALLLFRLSLIAVLIQTAYTILATNGPELVGVVSYYGLQTSIIVIGILQIYFSRKAILKSWIA